MPLESIDGRFGIRPMGHTTTKSIHVTQLTPENVLKKINVSLHKFMTEVHTVLVFHYIILDSY